MSTPGAALTDASAAPETAPWYRVPGKAVVSIEHPCIVQNVDKAILMLGGHDAVMEAVQDENERALALKFHPEDATSRSVISFNNNANNVLLRVTVPTRTGRKRKRGTNQPFVADTDEPAPSQDAKYLLRSLSDNADAYEIEPVGSIQSTHVWRAMPDFVYATQSSPFLEELKSKILPLQYPLMKEWELPKTFGLANTEVLPPPVLSTVSITQNYSYRQNPAVKQVTDSKTGERILHNTQAPVKIHTHQCQYDTASYPTALMPGCPPLATQPKNLQDLAHTIANIFKQRPIWTRRALINQLSSNAPFFLVRYAIAYVAYAIRSGPWRDTYCVLGQDPRTSPVYRKYQTILLQLVPKLTKNSGQAEEEARMRNQRKWSRSRDTQSHIFTGTKAIPEDGKVWQLCDIEDPQLKRLVDIPERYIRAECDLRYFGWYANGTGAKMRVLMRAKVEDLASSNGVAPDASMYEDFLHLPEEWEGPVRNEHGVVVEDVVSGYLPRNADIRQLSWASAYRSMCRTPLGSLPMGPYRLSKSKPETRASYLGPRSGSVDSAHRAATELLGEMEGVQTPAAVDGDEVAMDGFDEPEEGAELSEDSDVDGEVQLAIEAEGNLQEATSASENEEGADPGRHVGVAR